MICLLNRESNYTLKHCTLCITQIAHSVKDTLKLFSFVYTVESFTLDSKLLHNWRLWWLWQIWGVCIAVSCCITKLIQTAAPSWGYLRFIPRYWIVLLQVRCCRFALFIILWKNWTQGLTGFYIQRAILSCNTIWLTGLCATMPLCYYICAVSFVHIVASVLQSATMWLTGHCPTLCKLASRMCLLPPQPPLKYFEIYAIPPTSRCRQT